MRGHHLPSGDNYAALIFNWVSLVHQSSGDQVLYHVNGLGRQPTDRSQRLLQSQRPQLHDGLWFRIGVYGIVMVTILLYFISVFPLFNLITAINVSRLLYRALQTY